MHWTSLYYCMHAVYLPTESVKKDYVDSGSGSGTACKISSGAEPGGPMEIVFSFDTTGSMYPCLTQVSRGASDVQCVPRLAVELVMCNVCPG